MLSYDPTDFSMISPSKDGVNHICVSKGATTELGRKLDMGTRRPFHHPEDGFFESFIGWWLGRCNGKKEVFRSMHHENLMLTAAHDSNSDSDVWKDAVVAMKPSIMSDPELGMLLRNNPLPLYLYHVHRWNVCKISGQADEAIVPVTWFTPYIEVLNKISADYKAGL